MASSLHITKNTSPSFSVTSSLSERSVRRIRIFYLLPTGKSLRLIGEAEKATATAEEKSRQAQEATARAAVGHTLVQTGVPGRWDAAFDSTPQYGRGKLGFAFHALRRVSFPRGG